jgi:hypothetical protein
MIKYEKPHSKTLLVLDTRKDVLVFMSVSSLIVERRA